jgi:hypothetical protein
MSWLKDGGKTLNRRFRIADDPEATLSSIYALWSTQGGAGPARSG